MPKKPDLGDMVKALVAPADPMVIGGQFMGGVHLIYAFEDGRWKVIRVLHSLAAAKTAVRNLSASYRRKMRLVSHWAEKVEEYNGGEYVNSWEAPEANW